MSSEWGRGGIGVLGEWGRGGLECWVKEGGLNEIA